MSTHALRHAAPLLALAAGLAASATAGELEGRLVNGSKPDGVVPKFDVRLTARLANGDRLDEHTTTGLDGTFRFANVPGDTADVYVLSTNYLGVDYLSPFLKFGLGQSTLQSDLAVREITDDLGALAILGHHYIIECQADASRVMVTEVFEIMNASVETFRSHAPLTFPFPSDASEVTGLDGFETGFVEGGVMKLAAAIRPGGYEGAFRYFLPAHFPVALPLVVALPTEELTVLVAPPGTAVSAREGTLSPMGPVDLGEVVCDRYGVEATGGTVTVVVGAPRPAGRAAAPWIIVGMLLALFGGILFARERGTTGRRRPTDARLVAERDRYLVELLGVERQHAEGLRSAEELARERERLLTKAGALQELIDSSVERVS